jgi:hypothetical protein
MTPGTASQNFAPGQDIMSALHTDNTLLVPENGTSQAA